MQTVLGLMAVALLAYLGSALFRLDNLPPSLKALISSGVGLLAFGLALGPLALDVLTTDVLGRLDVLIELGVGWVGLLFGLQFNLVDLRRLPDRHFLGAFSQALLTMVVLGGGLLVAAWWMPTLGLGLMMILTLAAAGSASAPTALALVLGDLSPRGPLTDVLRLFNSVDALPAVILMGVALCVVPVHPLRYGWPLDSLYWIGVSVGLGLALGALFHLMTLYRYTDNQMLVVVLGLVVFCGGAAHYLNLSPLFVNFVVGAMVANRSPSRQVIFRALCSVEKPIYLILLTLAGAMWRPLAGWWWAVAAAFVAVRLLAKLLGGALAAPLASPSPNPLPLSLGFGLWDHGGMALVICLSATPYLSSAQADLILTAVLASVVITTGLGPWSLRRLLQRAGEVA